MNDEILMDMIYAAIFATATVAAADHDDDDDDEKETKKVKNEQADNETNIACNEMMLITS